MIFEITLEISNVAAGFGGITVVADPENNLFRFDLDWVEVGIAFFVLNCIFNGAFRAFVHPAIGLIQSGWRMLRAIEWRL